MIARYRSRLVLIVLGLLAGRAFAASGNVPLPTEGTRYSAAALYNMGNAAARADRPAEAVLNYERARLLAPQDPDIRANLQQVRAKAGLPQRSNWLGQYVRLANPDVLFWLGTFGIALTGASLLLRRSGATRRAPLAASASIGLALTLLSVGDAIATAPSLNTAVVMVGSSAVASPIGAAQPLFAIPRAEVVTIHDRYANYILVRDEENREGWVDKSALTPIIPRAALP